MYEIPLTRGQVAIVDEEDYLGLSQWKWSAHWNPHTKTYYAVRGEYLGKIDGRYKRRTVQMHRLIMDAPPRLQVNHRSGDTLDNRKSNLRLATVSQQGMNRRRRSDNLTGFKGVSRAIRGRFQAKIYREGRAIFLGTYTTPEEAHAVYSKAAISVHGEFRRTA